MNSLTKIIKLYFKQINAWLVLPWAITFLSFAVNIIISLALGGKTSIYTGGLSTIYCFVFVMSIVILSDTFPFAIGFGIRRTDYFLGTALAVLVFNAFTALLLFLFAFIENELTGGWGVNLHFFHLPYISDGSPIGQFWVSFAFLMHVYYLGFIIGSVYRRYGRTGILIFLTAALLLCGIAVALFTYLQLWVAGTFWLLGHSAVELATWLMLVAIGYAGVAYVLLRRATI